ncbi:MBL fold metallo-hydrolase [Streptomyces fractus]|uniref:MBL fold metallo-hydrolase n=1 Tax=Streptomyces fractus TaxID=641806 RepID=UPI003CF39F51
MTGTEQQAAWAARVLPPVEHLGGDVWSVPVPIPRNPLRYTLSYLLPGRTGLVVVDPGWDSDESWEVLRRGLAAAGAGPKDVTGIVATHVHPDHHGLSARLREASGAWVAMHPAERDSLPQRRRDTTSGRPTAVQDAHRWLAEAGAPDYAVLELLGPPEAHAAASAALPRAAEPDLLLEDLDRVPVDGRDIVALWTPGHTPGHLCLVDRAARAVLTGDHVLPRITPNIGLHSPRSDGRPLADFLASLERVAAWDDHEVLPAHEYRFRGLAARTRTLLDHHARRLAELLDVVDALGRPTPWDVAAHLSWSRPWAQVGAMRIAALAETEAHAQHLVERGELTRTHSRGDHLIRLQRPPGTRPRPGHGMGDFPLFVS